MVDLLSDLATDPLHPAALYSTFLRNAIASRIADSKDDASPESSTKDDIVSSEVTKNGGVTMFDHLIRENAEPSLNLHEMMRSATKISLQPIPPAAIPQSTAM